MWKKREKIFRRGRLKNFKKVKVRRKLGKGRVKKLEKALT